MSKGGHKFVPFDGLSVGTEDQFATWRSVFVAQYGDNAGYSDSDPIKAVAEAMEHAVRVSRFPASEHSNRVDDQ